VPDGIGNPLKFVIMRERYSIQNRLRRLLDGIGNFLKVANISLCWRVLVLCGDTRGYWITSRDILKRIPPPFPTNEKPICNSPENPKIPLKVRLESKKYQQNPNNKGKVLLPIRGSFLLIVSDKDDWSC
jgi:hypothetical protein